MAEYRDFWREFCDIQETTKKKILKRPNCEEAIGQLRRLAADMEDAEMPEHTAACHRAISAYYEQLQNFPLELNHLLRAAACYSAVRRVRHSLHIPVMQESEALMEECFLRAIEKCVKQRLLKTAAITAVETAEHFLKFHGHHRAYHYLLKASRFAQNDIYLTENILRLMCQIAETSPMEESDEMLAEIQAVWTGLLKDGCFSSVIRETLLKVEFHILLLNIRQARRAEDWQRTVLLPYAAPVAADISWQNSKTSVMSREEFSVAQQFVESIRAGDHAKASHLLHFELSALIGAGSAEFIAALVADIDNLPVVDYGFSEILSSADGNELDKRQKLFELYNSLVRKNQTKLENL